MADHGENPSILVVDDEPDTRDGCRHILARQGYPVFTAASGEEALRMLPEHPVSMVLLDLKMPGLSGMEALRRIRQIDGTVLVIVITGYATLETAIEAMKSGAYDFIAKPFDPDGLRIVVRRAHERLRLSAEAERLEAERRKTLTDLLTEKSRTRTILESLPDGVVATNAEGRVVLVNPSFLAQLGQDPERPPGERIESYVEDAGFCRMVRETSRGGCSDPGGVPTYEFTGRDGRVLLARGRPIIGEGGECLGTVATVSDISALRALDRVKSDFVAAVSHELRSPLSTIHEQIALVMRDVSGGDPSGDLPILGRALEKTHELISLVGDLLDLSRIETGAACRDPRPLDLGETLAGIVSFLGVRAQKRGQRLTLDLPAAPLPRLTADPFALESIFGNLVTNAINYTPEGGRIEVRARARGRGRGKPRSIEVSVADTGIGIDEGDLSRIFDRFFRVRSEKTRHVAGTGLGLPIVKGLVEGLGGTVGVTSAPGRGTTFTVVLPLEPEQPSSRAVPAG